MPKPLLFDKLSPAALRLFMALQTWQKGETWKDMIRRSGIKEMETYHAAYDQLVAGGFIVKRDGIEYPTLYEPEPEPEPPPRTILTLPGVVSRITKTIS